MKVLLIHDSLDASLKETQALLKNQGHEVATYHTAFEVLSEPKLDSFDVICIAFDLTGLNNYQLACLLKSRLNSIPIIVLEPAENNDKYLPLKLAADTIFTLDNNKIDCKKIVQVMQNLVENHKETMCKNPDNKDISDANQLCTNYDELVTHLLTENLVSNVILSLVTDIESDDKFIEHFLNQISSLLSCQLVGLVLADSDMSWAYLQLSKVTGQGAIDQVMNLLSQKFKFGHELMLDIRGTVESAHNNQLGEIIILPLEEDNRVFASLVFVSPPDTNFARASMAIINQLHLQSKSLIRLCLNLRKKKNPLAIEEFRASKDPLTGIYSQEFLLDFIRIQIILSQRRSVPLSVALIAIDNLGEINEKYGYETGDMVLMMVANKLGDNTRTSDLVARYRRAHFAIVLPNTDIEGAKVVAEKIISEIGQTKTFSNSERKIPAVQLSSGCADYTRKDTTPESILEEASQNINNIRIKRKVIN